MSEKPKTAFEIMQSLCDRYEAMLALEKVSEIIYLHPEWLEQEPRLKELIKLSA